MIFDDVPWRTAQQFDVRTLEVPVVNEAFPFQVDNMRKPRIVYHVHADGALPKMAPVVAAK